MQNIFPSVRHESRVDPDELLVKKCTGRKLTELPYNLISTCTNSPFTVVIILKQNLFMMTAGWKSINLYFSIHKCLFK